MRTLAMLSVAATCLFLAIPDAQATLILTPSDTRVVSDLTTTGVLGTVSKGTNATYAVRGRGNISENAEQVQTFLQFDVSSITPAMVNGYSFDATFRIDYTTRLNTANNFNVLVGRNQSGTWDSLGSSNPLHDWGFKDETSTVVAADGKLLVANVKTTAPTNDVTADVSDIVKGWVNGTNANQGFVLYYDSNQFQGIGLESAELLVNYVIPEPATLLIWSLLAGLGVGLGWRRRK